MKFLCDQCKAKYQIADEKVQGKTLRMKCRKCGHVIEIRAATEAPATGATMQLSALTEEAAAAIAKSIPPAAAPAAPGKPATPRPGAAAPPRAGVPMRTPTPRPQGLGGLGGTRPPGKAAEVPKSSGALASAFNKQVSSTSKVDAPPPSTSGDAGPDVPAEEWYVAIDDVPVGPIRLTELRAKYAQGLARDESLVWREGYEEWRPLRSLPELHRVVREEVSGALVPQRGGSLLPSTPPARNTSTRTSAPQSPSRPSPRPAAASPAPARSSGNVIPFVQPRGGAAAARKLEEEPEQDDEATMIAASPFSPQQLPKPKTDAAPVSGPAPRAFDDPFAPMPAAPIAPTPPPPAAPLVATSPASHSSVDDPGRATMLDKLEARGLSKGTVALIAAACLLIGVVVAVFAIKPKVVEKVVEKRVDVPVSVFVPTPGQTAPAETNTAAADPTTTAPKVAAKTGGGGGGAPAATPTVGTPSKKLGNDMGPEGPPIPGANTGPATGGGGSLDGKAVEGVVASKRVGVRKVCYEPWSDKGSASVKVTLKIGSDGRVQSADIATSSGEPAIGQCVQRLSKTWTFPPSEGGGTFNVPFLFGT
jgi:TonB family protein